jgi:hypothetical protein
MVGTKIDRDQRKRHPKGYTRHEVIALLGAGAVFHGWFQWALDDAHLDIDGAHDGAHGLELRGVPCGADKAAGASDDDGVGSAEAVGESTCEQAAEGRHTDKRHGVVAHDAATLVFGNERLDDGVAGGEALHHAEAHDEHEEERKREGVGEAKKDEADAEHDGGDLDHRREAANGLAQGEREGGDESAYAGGSHEIAEGVRAAVQDLRGEDRHEHHEGHSHEAEQREEGEDGADGTEVDDVGPALLQLFEHGGGGAFEGRWGEAHHEQGEHDGDVAEAVDGEAVAFAHGCDDDACDGGADEAGHIDDGGVEGDGVGEVLFVRLACVGGDHLDEEGLAAGHVEGVDETLEGTEGDDLVDGDDLGEGKPGHRERLDTREDLGPDEQLAAVDAVDEDTGEGCEEEGWNLSGEADQSEEKRGAGEAVDEPTGGDARHPGADKRDALAGEEEAEVTVAKGAPGVGVATRSWL